MSCTGWTNSKQLFGIFFGIPKNCLKFSDLKPPLTSAPQLRLNYSSHSCSLSINTLRFLISKRVSGIFFFMQVKKKCERDYLFVIAQMKKHRGGKKILKNNKKCNTLIRDLRVEEEKEINQVPNILQYFWYDWCLNCFQD